MSMPTGPGHYGEWISAHLDGELSRAQDARLQVHLLQCAACSDALAAEREARRLLLAATEAEPSAALTQRLLALACAEAPERAADQVPVAKRSADGRKRCPAELRTLRPGESPTFPALTGDLRSRRSLVAAVVVGVVGLGLGAGGLAALGAPPRVVPSAHRAEALTTLARTVGSGSPVASAGLSSGASIGGASSVDPAESDPTLARLRAEGWYVPRLVEGADVVAHRIDGDGRLELEVATSDGVVVLREQVGLLDTDALAGAAAVDAGGHTVHLLSQTPWHVAWQAGDLVLEAYCAEPNQLAERIVEAPDADVAAPVAVGRRIARGWENIMTVVAGR